jgi:glycosyltransferase involved in cell wall biosynthesis
MLNSIFNQNLSGFLLEVVIVDSGSTDNTLQIAQKFSCRICHIKKEDFTFGRSLNIGCEFANGDYLAFLSGHCVPTSSDWLTNLLKPLMQEVAEYSYGRQVGRDTTKFSEQCLFNKYFPEYSKVPQDGFFCNNANAAITRKVWKRYNFNEDLTGLEDMYLAKSMVDQGGKVAYVSEATVFHIHNEAWKQVEIRYERESYALQKIMPEVHLNIFDFFKYYLAGIREDILEARKQQRLIREFRGIIIFRLMQYWGAYKGNHEHRKLSKSMKHRYFYPKDLDRHIYDE